MMGQGKAGTRPFVAAALCAFLLGAGLVVLNWLCLVIFDDLLVTRAKHDIDLCRAGQHPYHWNMDADAELLERERNSLFALAFEDGFLRATAEDADPYFWLNLRGRYVDAQRYDQLRIRMYADRPSHLQVFHKSYGDESYVFGLDAPVEVSNGWQVLDLRLKELKWVPIAISDTEDKPSRADWGGDVRVVTGLRLDPVTDAGVQFQIDWVELAQAKQLAATQMPTAPVIVKVDSGNPGLASALVELAAHRGACAIAVDQNELRTPHHVRKLLVTLSGVAPDVIFLPRAAHLEAVRQVSEQIRPDVQDPLLQYRLVLMGAGMFALLFALLLLRAIRTGQTTLQAFSALVLFLLLAFSLLTLAGTGRNELFYVIAVLTALLGAYMFSDRDGSGLNRLGLNRPSAGNWRNTGLFTLIVAGLVLVIGFLNGDTFNDDFAHMARRFVTYVLWGGVQQIILGPLLGWQMLLALPQSWRGHHWTPLLVSLAAGFVFAILHAPHFELAFPTFLCGAFWVRQYLRDGSIVPQAISHGFLGTMWGALSLSWTPQNMRVGTEYLSWLW